MTEITTNENNLLMTVHCNICGGEIYGITRVVLRIGLEKAASAFVHSICLERLKENAGMDK